MNFILWFLYKYITCTWCYDGRSNIHSYVLVRLSFSFLISPSCEYGVLCKNFSFCCLCNFCVFVSWKRFNFRGVRKLPTVFLGALFHIGKVWTFFFSLSLFLSFAPRSLCSVHHFLCASPIFTSTHTHNLLAVLCMQSGIFDVAFPVSCRTLHKPRDSRLLFTQIYTHVLHNIYICSR